MYDYYTIRNIMSSAALLVDCQKIISIDLTIRIGLKIVKSWGKIGTTISKPQRKSSKLCSKIEIGPSTIPTFITTSPSISIVLYKWLRLQLFGCFHFCWVAPADGTSPAKKHAFWLCRPEGQRMDNTKEIYGRKLFEFTEFGQIYLTIAKIRLVIRLL